MRNLMLCILLCCSTCLYGAAEHTACSDTGYDWYRHSVTELRRIASTCSATRFSELNLHRAYYQDLVNEAAASASLINHTRPEGRTHFSTYAVQMILTEQFAHLYYPSLAARLEYLIGEYEVNNEIAELWLGGYTNLAARLSELQSKRHH